jgi:hypothetical protein
MFIFNIRLLNKFTYGINKKIIRYSSTLDIEMKKLNDANKFDKALSLYDQHEKENPLLISNKVVTQALKASTKLLDRQRGLIISKKIPLSSMNDSYLLASLIHMFSKLFFLVNICFFILFLQVEFNMIDEAVKIFEESKIRSESMFTTIIKGNQRTFFGKILSENKFLINLI